MIKRKAASEVFDNEVELETLSSTSAIPQSNLVTSEELQLAKEPIKIRETGFFRWKRVIIPPNAYVVHTRLGQDKPITLGLGTSFRYNPYTDAYMVVPAAMQTIGIVARSITKEKQGINILAYLQWQISDFSIAYRKVDFSDSRDSLGIVNAQLSEQAEAAIKDKIATMSVEEVLTDKAPIIAELIKRLESVTVGGEKEDIQEGLGIKIVTVQIREGLVSSEKLWQDLQAPFRHQQKKAAHISQLNMHTEIEKKELESRYLKETTEAETLTAIEHIKQSKQTERLKLQLAEEAIRLSKEQESIQQKKTLETEQALHAISEGNRLSEVEMHTAQQEIEQKTILEKQASVLKVQIQEQADFLEAQVLDARLIREKQIHQSKLDAKEKKKRLQMALQEKKMDQERMRQDIRNQINKEDLLRRLIDKSADIAAEMPDIQELKVLQTNHDDINFNSLSTFVTKILAVAENFGIPLTGSQKTEDNTAPISTSDN